MRDKLRSAGGRNGGNVPNPVDKIFLKNYDLPEHERQ
jgi:hypothetical protein